MSHSLWLIVYDSSRVTLDESLIMTHYSGIGWQQSLKSQKVVIPYWIRHIVRWSSWFSSCNSVAIAKISSWSDRYRHGQFNWINKNGIGWRVFVQCYWSDLQFGLCWRRWFYWRWYSDCKRNFNPVGEIKSSFIFISWLFRNGFFIRQVQKIGSLDGITWTRTHDDGPSTAWSENYSLSYILNGFGWSINKRQVGELRNLLVLVWTGPSFFQNIYPWPDSIRF